VHLLDLFTVILLNQIKGKLSLSTPRKRME